MSTLFVMLEKEIASLNPNELAILAKVILDAAIGGDFLALKFVLEAGLRESEIKRLAAFRESIRSLTERDR